MVGVFLMMSIYYPVVKPAVTKKKKKKAVSLFSEILYASSFKFCTVILHWALQFYFSLGDLSQVD